MSMLSRPGLSGSRVSRFKLRLFRSAAIVLGLLAATATGELAARVLLTWTYRGRIDRLTARIPANPAADVQLFDMIQRDPDAKIQYRLKPGARGIFVGGHFEIDSLGFRDGPVAVPKPPHTLRVVCLGDSSMFGHGVELPQAYPKLLQFELQSLAPPGERVEFVDTAVPGYNTEQEVETFEKHGLPLEPDAVLIQYDYNDILPPLGTFAPDFLRARYFFMAHPLALASGRLTDARAFMEISQWGEAMSRFDLTSGWQSIVRNYERLANLCRERKLPLLALTIFDINALPRADAPYATDPSYKNIQETWKKLGIPFVDTVPAAMEGLRAHRESWDRAFLSRADPHPSPEGHALIAGALLEPLRKLLSAGLAPAETAPVKSVPGNQILRAQTARGLYATELWDSVPVNWTAQQAQFDFIPGGRKLLIPILAHRPDLSPTRPLQLQISVDGVRDSRHPSGSVERHCELTGEGATTLELDIGDLAGSPLTLTIAVDRTIAIAPDPRRIGIALYPLAFSD